MTVAVLSGSWLVLPAAAQSSGTARVRSVVVSLVADAYNGDMIPSIGASGAVFGVVASFAMIFPNMLLQLLFPPIRLKAKYMVLLFVIFELSYSLQNLPGDKIGHTAHLAGMFFALIMIKFIWKIPKRY
jgi:membrane associated rhomboid family serine protease